MPNGMMVDRSSLTYNALGLRALANVPLGTRREYTRSAAAIEVAVGIGVFVGKAGGLGEHVVRGHPLAIV